MIASIRGEVLDVALDHVVIEAAVSDTASTRRLDAVGPARNRGRLVTAMIVREDSMTCGFTDSDACDLFTTLLSVWCRTEDRTSYVHDAPPVRRWPQRDWVDQGADRQAQPNGWCGTRDKVGGAGPRSDCLPSTVMRCVVRGGSTCRTWLRPLPARSRQGALTSRGDAVDGVARRPVDAG
jgi:Holliday junction DNA helicase RuvA